MRAVGVTLRPARARDAAAIWRVLPAVGNLERNSAYAYLLLCTHFADTSIVAERDGAIVGFVLGYRPPSQHDAMFVWQVGVAPEARGAGLASHMLDRLLANHGCAGVRMLTATVSPDNTASLALFRAFARRRGVPCVEAPCFPADLFPHPHPDENLLQIGPLVAAERK
jgi:L-2,4-diaminobutyric acid acetyltransferase